MKRSPSSAPLIAVAVPLKTSVLSLVPSPVVNCRPAVEASVSVPCVTASVAVSVPPSGSVTVSAVPLAAENSRGWSSPELAETGTVTAGGVFGTTTLMETVAVSVVVPLLTV